ncbi:protein ABHD15-like [Anguilla rostrata]|uniref:protein ABHD15-like n=1 Tax=Anguilla rostrata TaxID=7938 RepID=UPI0030D2137A
MLEWFFAVCILIAAALFWPASLYFASGGPLPVPPGAPGRRILGCRTGGRRGDRCGPDLVPTATGEAEGAALVCKPSALARYLQRHCAAFRSFVAAPRWSWRASAFLQTVAAACWPAEGAVRFARDHLQVADGGLVALDWAVAGGEGHKRRRTASDSASPVLLVIPNSFGKITWNVLKLCDLGLSHGYAPVVFNRRGQNGAALATPRLQRFGDPADLREAVRYLRYRRPGARLYAASESTGAGLLLSYLGECGSSSYLTAAACLSPVLRCQAWYESTPCWPYGWALLLYQKICLSRYKTALGETIRTDAVFSCSSLKSLEEALFCQPEPEPRGASGREGGGAEGGVSWEEYWESNEPLRDVDEVAVPVLCVCSRDDPVRGDPSTTLPFDLFHSNPHLFLLLTEQGGHCGFAQPGGGAGGGVMGTAPWSHRALLEFFRGVTDFFAAEERAQAASHRRGLRGGAGAGPVAVGNSRGFRHCSISACKRLPACSHSIHSIYSWQRSYTR